METCRRLFWLRGVRWAGLAIVVATLLSFAWLAAPSTTRAAEHERVITIYYDDIQETVVTSAATVEEVLERADIPLGKHDAVEPARDTQLVAPAYNINIYRARPVMVIDGVKRYQVMSPHTSARHIAEAAGLKVHAEDEFTLTRIDNFLKGGVGLELTIHRSMPITFTLYGKKVDIRTQAITVEELLTEKNVTLGPADGTNVSPHTPIAAGMTVEVWRNGVQTITQEEDITFPVEQIRDVDKPVGFKEVREAGEPGKKVVTYEVELRNGQEISRKEIQSVVAKEPKKQIEVIGIKSSGGLSKSKGVHHHVDSQGVGHRETYYDLPMNGVMGFCGGGPYSVRPDGAKVDQDGYILVAANLSRYPRCSIVETSLGLGKVYDTGGFAAVHPHGFDLATDWTNNNGR